MAPGTGRDTQHLLDTGLTGGQLPLTWRVSDSLLGEMHPSPTRTAIYDRVGASSGINAVTVSDVQGLSATATLIQ